MNLAKSAMARSLAGVVPLLAAFAPGTALAHPNHVHAPLAGFWANVAHLLSEPDHVALLVAALVVAVIGARALRQRRNGERGAEHRGPRD
jgi:hydrogenase/urease accessory protein HupE